MMMLLVFGVFHYQGYGRGQYKRKSYTDSDYTKGIENVFYEGAEDEEEKQD